MLVHIFEKKKYFKWVKNVIFELSKYEWSQKS